MTRLWSHADRIFTLTPHLLDEDALRAETVSQGTESALRRPSMAVIGLDTDVPIRWGLRLRRDCRPTCAGKRPCVVPAGDELELPAHSTARSAPSAVPGLGMLIIPTCTPPKMPRSICHGQRHALPPSRWSSIMQSALKGAISPQCTRSIKRIPPPSSLAAAASRRRTNPSAFAPSPCQRCSAPALPRAGRHLLQQHARGLLVDSRAWRPMAYHPTCSCSPL